MEIKKIFNTSGYEQALRVLLLGVAGDKARVKMPDSTGGHIWSSSCKEVENDAGRFNITIIKRDGSIVGKFVYNYDDAIEREYIYNSVEKDYTLVEEAEK